MSKWCGKIGYAETVETEPGIWEEQIVEKDQYGDLIENRYMRQTSSESVNDDLKVSTKISVIADPYIMSHCSSMIYAELMGTKWKITNIDLQYPKLVLTLGGVWNGNRPTGTTV